MIAEATVATTRPPNEPANKNEMIANVAISSMASGYLACSSFHLIMRKLNATAIPMTANITPDSIYCLWSKSSCRRGSGVGKSVVGFCNLPCSSLGHPSLAVLLSITICTACSI